MGNGEGGMIVQDETATETWFFIGWLGVKGSGLFFGWKCCSGCWSWNEDVVIIKFIAF